MNPTKDVTSKQVDREIETVLDKADAYLLATDLNLSRAPIRERLSVARARRRVKPAPSATVRAYYWRRAQAVVAAITLVAMVVFSAHFHLSDGGDENFGTLNIIVGAQMVFQLGTLCVRYVYMYVNWSRERKESGFAASAEPAEGSIRLSGQERSTDAIR